LILDSLRYWVDEMHVDGFRFDLTSALARTGHDIDMRSAFLATISQDPVLRHVKLIAEPWDASMDGYQVGSFPPPWVEWNDHYRDVIRDFWRGRSASATWPPAWPVPPTSTPTTADRRTPRSTS
jgi:pullulanase/glycogen debranching enzyme